MWLVSTNVGILAYTNTSHVTCHWPQPHTFPLLTAPLCTVGWFTKTKNTTQKIQNANIVKFVWKKTFHIYLLLEISQSTRSLPSIGKLSSNSNSGLKHLWVVKTINDPIEKLKLGAMLFVSYQTNIEICLIKYKN